MRIARKMIALGAWVVLPVVGAAAQTTLPIRPGDRVRITADERYTGTVLIADSGRLLLVISGPADTLALLFAAIRKLEVGRGQKSALGRGARAGAVIGASLGFLVGLGMSCESGSYTCAGPVAIPVGTAIGAAVGAVPGALIGALGHTERWETVPLNRLQVGVRPAAAPP
jgi:hypothetical protein